MKNKFKRQKFRKRGKRSVSVKTLNNLPFLIPVKPNKTVKKPKQKTISYDYFLNPSELDRMHYSYESDQKGIIQKVVNVSYEVCIESAWVPVVRFDSEHGYLHRHMRISKDDPREIRSIAGVKKKGTPRNWLSWAIRELDKTYLNYRVGFFKRSKIKDLY